MSRALRLFALAIIGCILQTNVVQYIRIADVAPDMMIALIVALTSFCGYYGIFCTSALMIMFYDASVGYVMALNPVAYILIALAANASREILIKKLVKFKVNRFALTMCICLFLTLCREAAYLGYLFLIGSAFEATAIARLFLSAGYTTLMMIPCHVLIHSLLNWHPIGKKQKKQAFVDDDDLLESP